MSFSQNKPYFFEGGLHLTRIDTDYYPKVHELTDSVAIAFCAAFDLYLESSTVAEVLLEKLAEARDILREQEEARAAKAKAESRAAAQDAEESGYYKRVREDKLTGDAQ